MKTFRITSILVLVFTVNLSLAQSSRVIAKIDQKVIEKEPRLERGGQSDSVLSVIHSNTAGDQIRKSLLKNLVYPELMLDNCMEGQVILKVAITYDGMISHISIAKSANSYFAQATIAASVNLERIDLDGQKYRGVPTIYVPLDFHVMR